MKKIITICLIFSSLSIFANGINISGVSFNSATNQLSFTVSWENSWTYFSTSPDLFEAALGFRKICA